LLGLLNKQNIKAKIQISLHSLNPDIRKKIFNNKSVELNLIKRAGITASANFEVEYNYTLIESVNDSFIDALNLTKFYKETLIPIKINQFNSVSVYKSSTEIIRNKFMEVLREHNVKFEYYETNGFDIKAACGQLIGGIYS